MVARDNCITFKGTFFLILYLFSSPFSFFSFTVQDCTACFTRDTHRQETKWKIMLCLCGMCIRVIASSDRKVIDHTRPIGLTGCGCPVFLLLWITDFILRLKTCLTVQVNHLARLPGIFPVHPLPPCCTNWSQRYCPSKWWKVGSFCCSDWCGEVIPSLGTAGGPGSTGT